MIGIILLIAFWIGVYYYIKHSKDDSKCSHCGSHNTKFLYEELDKTSKYGRELYVHKCNKCNGDFERMWNNDYIGVTKITYKR